MGDVFCPHSLASRIKAAVKRKIENGIDMMEVSVLYGTVRMLLRPGQCHGTLLCRYMRNHLTWSGTTPFLFYFISYGKVKKRQEEGSFFSF